MNLELLSEIAMAVLIPVTIACVAWRNRATRPIAARLFIAAAICLLLPLGITIAEDLLGINDVFALWESAEQNPENELILIEDQLNFGNPVWRRMIAEQLIHSCFNILAWSLMAWAILRQPDERSRAVIAP